jgi:ABC-type lipoprotein release transport system permease subunit
VYGVTARSVARRTREIGIRVAWGAEPGRGLTSVLGQGFRLAALGAGVGLAISWFASRVLEGCSVE